MAHPEIPVITTFPTQRILKELPPLPSLHYFDPSYEHYRLEHDDMVASIADFLYEYHERTPFPTIMHRRAHHQSSDRLAIDFAQKNGHISLNETFYHQGTKYLPTTHTSITDFLKHPLNGLSAKRQKRRLYEYLASFSLRYYDLLRTERPEIVYKNAQGEDIAYNRDRRGDVKVKNEEIDSSEGWRHVLEDAIVTSCMLTAPDCPLYLTAFPDRRCEACAIGGHCFKNTILVPEQAYTKSAANRGYQTFHPRDQRMIVEFMHQSLTEEPLIITDYYQVPQVFSPDAVKAYKLRTINIPETDCTTILSWNEIYRFNRPNSETLQCQEVIPVAVRTTLADYRANLISPPEPASRKIIFSFL